MIALGMAVYQATLHLKLSIEEREHYKHTTMGRPLKLSESIGWVGVIKCIMKVFLLCDKMEFETGMIHHKVPDLFTGIPNTE